MNVYQISILLLAVWVDLGRARKTCRPPCDPPGDLKGCGRFNSVDKCDDDSSEDEVTLMECGCMWKTFIQSLVEPERFTVFTPDGIQCFVWAMTMCEVKDYTSPEPTQILDVETGDVFGKVEGVAGTYKTADEVDEVVLPGATGSVGHGYRGQTRSRDRSKGHWSFYWGMNDEKFKLTVFALILLFNAVCVAVAVCCRCDSKTREKQARMSGDLDPNTYVKQISSEKPPRTVSIDKFLEKFRQYKKAKMKERDNPYGILQMDHLKSKKQPMFKPGPYQCVYNSTDENSDVLNSTYEEPMPSNKGMSHVRRKDMYSDDDENTLYESVHIRNFDKSVKFQTSQGATPDQKARVPTKKSKRGDKYEMMFTPKMMWTK